MATSSKSQKTPTSAKAWKGKRETGSFDLELPSGNVCRIKALTIPEMIASGVLGDTLLPIAQEHIDKGKGKAPKDFQKKAGAKTASVTEDPKKMAEMFDAIDRAMPQVVVDPVVKYHKDKDGVVIDDEDRDEDVLYVDQVDFEDKFFIFNAVVGGTTDLEEFRKEAGSAVDGLQTGASK